MTPLLRFITYLCQHTTYQKSEMNFFDKWSRDVKGVNRVKKGKTDSFTNYNIMIICIIHVTREKLEFIRYQNPLHSNNGID